jgi:hypothetical protein
MFITFIFQMSKVYHPPKRPPRNTSLVRPEPCCIHLPSIHIPRYRVMEEVDARRCCYKKAIVSMPRKPYCS